MRKARLQAQSQHSNIYINYSLHNKNMCQPAEKMSMGQISVFSDVFFFMKTKSGCDRKWTFINVRCNVHFIIS